MSAPNVEKTKHLTYRQRKKLSKWKPPAKEVISTFTCPCGNKIHVHLGLGELQVLSRALITKQLPPNFTMRHQLELSELNKQRLQMMLDTKHQVEALPKLETAT